MDFSKTERDFASAMRQYTKLTSKTSEEALNKAAKDVLSGNSKGGVTGTIKRTAKADAKKVRAYFTGPGRDGKGSLAYRMVAKQGLKREEIEALVKKFIAAHTRSVGYIKAGWYKAARVFGGRSGRVSELGKAAEGKGKKATSWTLTATMSNHATGATEISGEALAKSMEEKRKDLLVYIADKLSKGWGRKR